MAAAQNTQDKAPEPVATTATAGPTAAGRLQQGEQATGLTTRPPRGVDEPAADEVADNEGIKALQEAVTKTVNEQTAKGYRGSQVDSTPNSHYTVRGVTKGLPTPETAVVTPKGA